MKKGGEGRGGKNEWRTKKKGKGEKKKKKRDDDEEQRRGTDDDRRKETMAVQVNIMSVVTLGVGVT